MVQLLGVMKTSVKMAVDSVDGRHPTSTRKALWSTSTSRIAQWSTSTSRNLLVKNYPFISVTANKGPPNKANKFFSINLIKNKSLMPTLIK